MKIQIDHQIYDTTPKWYSYTYIGKGAHQYLPCKYEVSNGFDNTAYVSADDSLWTIDTPESPESILALLMPSTLELKIPPLDLRNTLISFSLRGDDLKLHGAKCYFWIVTFLPITTRWHYVSQPLDIPEGRWSELQTLQLIPEKELWHCSFSLQSPEISLEDSLNNCMSFGFSFVDFSQKVTGKLSLSNFSIHQNLDTREKYFANFHNFANWLTLSRNKGCQIPAPTDVHGRVIMLHDENYLVLRAQNINYVYLAFIKRIDSTRSLQMHNRMFFFMLGWREISPTPHIDYKRGNMYFFLENSLSNTIWILRQPINQEITLGKLLLHDDKNSWFQLTGNAPLNSVMAGEADKFGYDYLGLMLVGVNNTPTGYWTLAEFFIS